MAGIPLWKRPIDILILILLCYFLFSCIFIERHYCERGLEADDADWLMKATYDYSYEYNPLFLSRPEWLRAATCISAYGLGAGYIIGVITFVVGINCMRIPLLMFCGFKLYALTLYYYLEFFGSMPAPDILMFLAPEGVYYLALFLILFRLRTAHPFTTARKIKAN